MKRLLGFILTCCLFFFSSCIDPSDKDNNGGNTEYHEYVESLLDHVEDWDGVIGEISQIVEMLEDELTRLPSGSKDARSLKSKIDKIKDRLSDVMSYKSEILKVAAQILLESDSKLAEYALKEVEADLKEMVKEIQAIGEIL